MPQLTRWQYICLTPAGRDLRHPWGFWDGVDRHDQPWAKGVRDAPSQVVWTTGCACSAQRILGGE